MNKKVVTVTLNPALDKTVVIDTLNVGGLNRAAHSRIDPGGKGINVAKVLHNFGVSVETAGLIAGAQGDLLLEYLRNEGIQADFLKIPGETRINLKIVERLSGRMTEVNEAGFAVKKEQIYSFTERLSRLLDEASVLVLGGSLPVGAESNIYREYIELAKSKGVKTILDADGEAFAEGIKGIPFAIKPNIHELEKWAGYKMVDDDAVIRTAGSLIGQGIHMVIVSMGAEGAIVLDEREIYRVEACPILCRSTVGAGDSMVGALAYSLLNHLSIREIAAWTTSAGAVTASKPGTEICSFEEVMQNLDKVKMKKYEGDIYYECL